MIIRNLRECKEFIAGDNTTLRELLNPLRDDLRLGYSLAHASVKPGQKTFDHILTSSEVYYILQGNGIMRINEESKEVKTGQAVYIQPNATQSIENVGLEELVFLCIVDPAWSPDVEKVLPR